ncbi:MAG: cyclodeaminase/cyclohydrolase family protein, partial [Anaerolineaceae bacterium]|nr:cyclodeaminase/cyclohydrolase family protein [Anaerolineaceae bacterium]
LDQLADANPTPGGGSAAAHTGAVAAALVAMVARLTIGKKKYAAVEEQMQELITRADQLRAELTAAETRDAAAFEAYMEAMKMPKDTPDQIEARSKAITDAKLMAAQVPLEVAHMAVGVMEMALQAAAHGNANAITDAASGCLLARAALLGAGLNIRINLDGFEDQNLSLPILQELSSLEARSAQNERELKTTLTERAGLPLPVA